MANAESIGNAAGRAVDAWRAICTGVGLEVNSETSDTTTSTATPAAPSLGMSGGGAGTSNRAALVTGLGSTAMLEQRPVFMSAIASIRAALQRQQVWHSFRQDFGPLGYWMLGYASARVIQ
jgi:hypothetical protein